MGVNDVLITTAFSGGGGSGGSGVKPTGEKYIEENGTYNIAKYASVNVDVPNPSEGTLTITSNNVYDVTDYASAAVNVPNPSTGTLTITRNNTYDVTNYASVAVNVPNPSTGKLTITSNSAYDVTNYAIAEVNVVNPPARTVISFNNNTSGALTVRYQDYNNAQTFYQDGDNIASLVSINRSIFDGGFIEASSNTAFKVGSCSAQVNAQTEAVLIVDKYKLYFYTDHSNSQHSITFVDA